MYTMEKHLHLNGTKIVKIFLFFRRGAAQAVPGRIDEPDKNWKFSLA